MEQPALTELDATLAKAKVSLAFRRNHQVLVRSILRAALVAEFLPAMPDLPKLLKLGHKVAKVPATEEVDRVIAASRAHQRVALALAVHAGLRAGEIRGLRRCDVDLRVGLLTIRENRCHGKISAPKSGHERVVPIADALRPHLVAAFGCGTSDPRAHVCRTRLGEPLSQNSIYDALERAQVRAGVSGWKVHALRHHFVTTLFRRGVGANVVQRLAGHHSLTVTQRYAHTTEIDLREAVALLGGGNSVVTAASTSL